MNAIRPWRDIMRRQSRQIMVGNVPVGGDAPITVQTMTNTLTSDAEATIDQIRRCEDAGRGHHPRLLPGRGKHRGAAARSSARLERPDRRRHPFPLQARARSGRCRRGLPAHQPRQYRLQPSAWPKWSARPRPMAARSASASTPAASRRTCSKNTASPAPKRWSKARSTISSCCRTTISTNTRWR